MREQQRNGYQVSVSRFAHNLKCEREGRETIKTGFALDLSDRAKQQNYDRIHFQVGGISSPTPRVRRKKVDGDNYRLSGLKVDFDSIIL